jgi:hypothetical protein
MAEADAFVAAGRDELRLSNLGQLELLRAMRERGVALRTSVRGFSMWPFICDEDVLTIAPVGGCTLRLGDVVAFALPKSGQLAIHRVVARDRAGCLVRGDNARDVDGVVALDEILGRVARVERGGRDVGGGLGRLGFVIAALSRAGILWRLTALCRALKRGTSFVLRWTRAATLSWSTSRRRRHHP